MIPDDHTPVQVADEHPDRVRLALLTPDERRVLRQYHALRDCMAALEAGRRAVTRALMAYNRATVGADRELD